MFRLLLGPTLGLILAQPAAASLSYAGEARHPDSGELLYEEHHLLRTEDGRPRERLVLYRCPDGAAFARKRVDYGATPRAPEFALDDARFGYREGVRREGDALAAFFRPDAASRERAATLQPAAALVIDAGFDEFVREHWSALQRGESVPVQFLVPSRLDTYGFTLQRIGEVSIAGDTASVFRLSLGGILGWFAPDIEVSYRTADRRLMRFEGLTNIRADRRDNLVARIEFPPRRERAGLSPEQWQSAADEALQSCRPGR